MRYFFNLIIECISVIWNGFDDINRNSHKAFFVFRERKGFKNGGAPLPQDTNRGFSHHNALFTPGTPLGRPCPGQRLRAHMIPVSMTYWDLAHLLHFPLLDFVGLSMRRVREREQKNIFDCRYTRALRLFTKDY